MRKENTEILTAHLRNIYASYATARLHRSILTLDGTKVFRRIACYVDPKTGDCMDGEISHGRISQHFCAE